MATLSVPHQVGGLMTEGRKPVGRTVSFRAQMNIKKQSTETLHHTQPPLIAATRPASGGAPAGWPSSPSPSAGFPPASGGWPAPPPGHQYFLTPMRHPTTGQIVMVPHLYAIAPTAYQQPSAPPAFPIPSASSSSSPTIADSRHSYALSSAASGASPSPGQAASPHLSRQGSSPGTPVRLTFSQSPSPSRIPSQGDKLIIAPGRSPPVSQSAPDPLMSNQAAPPGHQRLPTPSRAPSTEHRDEPSELRKIFKQASHADGVPSSKSSSPAPQLSHTGSAGDFYGMSVSEPAISSTLSSSSSPQASSTPRVVDHTLSSERELHLAYCRTKNQLFIDDLGFDNGTFSSGEEEIEKLTDEALESEMIQGSYVRIFWRNQRPREMYLKLSSDCRSVVVLPSAEAREDAKDSFTNTLSDVLELRKGQKTTAFERFPQPEINHKCFSLVWGFRRDLSVACETVRDFNKWTVGLARIISKLKLEDPQVSIVAREWTRQFGERKTLDLELVCQLLVALNAKPKKSLLTKKVHEVLERSAGGASRPSSSSAKTKAIAKSVKTAQLSFEQFLSLLRSLRARSNIAEMFHSYNLINGLMPPGEFWKFLQCEQMEKDVSLNEATDILREWQSDDSGSAVGLTLDEFSNYLTSSSNSALDPFLVNNVTHDMNQPISHYFIACSHNTYLESNQFTGTSSVDMYIRVLKTACRCIELDCWDGPDGEPLITHGNTLTSTIRVVDVLYAIRDWAFCVTEYPLILSLELHLSKEQQNRFATHLREILGDILPHTVPALLNPDAPFLPTPYELRGRVLLKASGKLTQSLAELIFFKGKSFKGFSVSKTNKAFEMSSFAEGDIKRLSRIEFVQHNYRYLSRSYPKGTRIDSSNFDPFPSWNAGVQLVALNYQSEGPKLWVEKGKFRGNGSCGYLLKPYYMRQPDTIYDVAKLNKRDPCEKSRVKVLKIKVLSARQCPKPKEGDRKITDPAIELTMEGIPTDCKTYRTRRISSNGFSPEWDKEFTFRLALSEMAVLLVSIFDEHMTSSTRLAYAALPVDCLRPGFRIINFNDCNGCAIPFCDLFVYITLNPKNF